MALNYLQRVAGAAARISAQAKPAATGPPRMPGIPAPPVQQFASAEPQISEADSILPPAPQAFHTAEPPEAKTAPLPPPTPAREHRPAESTPSRIESLLRPPAEVIRTPPGLRSLARSNPDRTMQPAPPPPPPPLPANLEARPEPAQQAASTDIQPAPTPQAVVTTAMPAQPAPAAPAPVPLTAVAPKPQAPAALPNSRTAKTESRIQIGRVEVQVNNTRPARPAPQAAPAASPTSDFLAARYLSRFTLRP